LEKKFKLRKLGAGPFKVKFFGELN